jgi:hypothetical protein
MTNQRQKEDQDWFDILNRLRIGSFTQPDLDKIAARKIIPTGHALIDLAANILASECWEHSSERNICILPTTNAVDAFNEQVIKKLHSNHTDIGKGGIAGF